MADDPVSEQRVRRTGRPPLARVTPPVRRAPAGGAGEARARSAAEMVPVILPAPPAPPTLRMRKLPTDAELAADAAVHQALAAHLHDNVRARRRTDDIQRAFWLGVRDHTAGLIDLADHVGRSVQPAPVGKLRESVEFVERKPDPLLYAVEQMAAEPRPLVWKILRVSAGSVLCTLGALVFVWGVVAGLDPAVTAIAGASIAFGSLLLRPLAPPPVVPREFVAIARHAVEAAEDGTPFWRTVELEPFAAVATCPNCLSNRVHRFAAPALVPEHDPGEFGKPVVWRLCSSEDSQCGMVWPQLR